jgi:hypothetical protein
LLKSHCTTSRYHVTWTDMIENKTLYTQNDKDCFISSSTDQKGSSSSLERSTYIKFQLQKTYNGYDLLCSVISTTWLFFIRTVNWCYKLCYSATNQGLSKFQQIERVLPLKWCCSKIIFHGRFFLKMYNWFLSLRPSNFLCLMK